MKRRNLSVLNLEPNKSPRSSRRSSRRSPSKSNRRKSAPVADASPVPKSARRGKRSAPAVLGGKRPTTKVRAHTQLPLMHDFKHLYGIPNGLIAMRNKTIENYDFKVYPWKNTSVSEAFLRQLVKRKEAVVLGRMPGPSIMPIKNLSTMTGHKRNFAAWVATPDPDLAAANRDQIDLDTGVRGSSWMRQDTRTILMQIFVEDPEWKMRVPPYIQASDMMIQRFNIPKSTDSISQRKAMIYSLRLLLLAMQFTFPPPPHPMSLTTMHLLGTKDPMHPGLLSTDAILPLYEWLQVYIRKPKTSDILHLHTAYELAQHLKRFYVSQTRDANAGKTPDNTLQRMTSFLNAGMSDLDLQHFLTSTPDGLITYRGI